MSILELWLLALKQVDIDTPPDVESVVRPYLARNPFQRSVELSTHGDGGGMTYYSEIVCHDDEPRRDVLMEHENLLYAPDVYCSWFPN